MESDKSWRSGEMKQRCEPGQSLEGSSLLYFRSWMSGGWQKDRARTGTQNQDPHLPIKLSLVIRSQVQQLNRVSRESVTTRLREQPSYQDSGPTARNVGDRATRWEQLSTAYIQGKEFRSSWVKARGKIRKCRRSSSPREKGNWHSNRKGNVCGPTQKKKWSPTLHHETRGLVHLPYHPMYMVALNPLW